MEGNIKETIERIRQAVKEILTANLLNPVKELNPYMDEKDLNSPLFNDLWFYAKTP